MAVELVNVINVIVYAIISAYIAILAIYIGLAAFTRITKNIDEVAELKKGNIAMGAVLGAMAIVIGLVTIEPIKIITAEFLAGRIINGIILAIVQLGTNILIAVIVQIVIIGIFNEFTKRRGLDQLQQLQSGNVAIGVGLAGIIVMVGLILQPSSEVLALTLTNIISTSLR